MEGGKGQAGSAGKGEVLGGAAPDVQRILGESIRRIVATKYCIKEDFYLVKNVNDIIFHNQTEDGDSQMFEEDRLAAFRIKKDVH